MDLIFTFYDDLFWNIFNNVPDYIKFIMKCINRHTNDIIINKKIKYDKNELYKDALSDHLISSNTLDCFNFKIQNIDMLRYAVYSDNVNTVKWFMKGLNILYPYRTCSDYAKMKINGCDYIDYTNLPYMYVRSKTMFDFLVENGYEINKVNYAALNGKYNLFKTLVNKCGTDKYTNQCASYGGNRRIIKWLIINRCTFDSKCAKISYERNRNFDILGLMLKSENISDDMLNIFIMNRDLNAIQWITEKKLNIKNILHPTQLLLKNYDAEIYEYCKSILICSLRSNKYVDFIEKERGICYIDNDVLICGILDKINNHEIKDDSECISFIQELFVFVYSIKNKYENIEFLYKYFKGNVHIYMPIALNWLIVTAYKDSELMSLLKKMGVKDLDHDICYEMEDALDLYLVKNNEQNYDTIKFNSVMNGFYLSGDLFYKRIIKYIVHIINTKTLPKNMSNLIWQNLTEQLFCEAIRFGDINVLGWLIDNKCDIPEHLYERLIYVGNVKNIKWIIDKLGISSNNRCDEKYVYIYTKNTNNMYEFNIKHGFNIVTYERFNKNSNDSIVLNYDKDDYDHDDPVECYLAYIETIFDFNNNDDYYSTDSETMLDDDVDETNISYEYGLGCEISVDNIN